MSDAERQYPCANCGVLRTKDEGGTTFTVCDDCLDTKPDIWSDATRVAFYAAEKCDECGGSGERNRKNDVAWGDRKAHPVQACKACMGFGVKIVATEPQ